MLSKDEIIDELIFSGLSFAGIYITYNNSKYFTLPTFLFFVISRYVGKILKVSIQEDNAGGTTPYNPLKIPAKIYNFTPAKKQPAGGTTPYNPLKIPAQKITPIH